MSIFLKSISVIGDILRAHGSILGIAENCLGLLMNLCKNSALNRMRCKAAGLDTLIADVKTSTGEGKKWNDVRKLADHVLQHFV